MYLGIFLIDLLVVGLNQGADPLCNGNRSYFDVDLSRRLDGGHCTVHVPVHQHFYLSGNSSIYLCWRSDVCLRYILCHHAVCQRHLRQNQRGRRRGHHRYLYALRAITGSSLATITGIGGMMLPELEKAGYAKKYATALISACGFRHPDSAKHSGNPLFHDGW